MQTYTHLAAGIVVSRVLFSDDIAAQLVTVGASLAPDVPTAVWYALDKIQGKEPFSNFDERKGFHFAIDVSHSLVAWLPFVFLLGFLSSQMALSIIAGVYVHLWTDVISHTDRGPDPDPSWVWPLELLSPEVRLSGIFDYRVIWHSGSGSFGFFTPLDIIISSVLFIVFLVLTF